MSYKKVKIKSSISDLDEVKGIVKIRVSAFNNIDSYGDIVDEKAFNKTISDFKATDKTRVSHLKDHNWDLFLGVPLEMEATKDGLDVVSAINMGKEIGRDQVSDYLFKDAHKQTVEHSFGYTVVKEEYSKSQNANILKEVNLMEYSSISFLGANSETPLLGLKNNNMDSKELIKRIENLEARLKTLEPSDDTQAVVVETEEKTIDVKLFSKLKFD